MRLFLTQAHFLLSFLYCRIVAGTTWILITRLPPALQDIPTSMDLSPLIWDLMLASVNQETIDILLYYNS